MSNITKSDIKEILLEDLENKKPFDANWESACSLDGADIAEGDSFYFMGNKKKICVDCYRNIVAEVENMI